MTVRPVSVLGAMLLALASCAPAGGKRVTVVPATAQETLRGPLTLALPRFPSGERYSLESDRGNVVVLDVWATWCEPCRESLPFYETLFTEHREKGLRVYAVNIDADRRQVEQFLTQLQLSLPVLYDEDAAVAESQLGVRVMPTTFYLDRKGRVRQVHEGFLARETGRYRADIEALLAEEP